MLADTPAPDAPLDVPLLVEELEELAHWLETDPDGNAAAQRFAALARTIHRADQCRALAAALPGLVATGAAARRLQEIAAGPSAVEAPDHDP